MCVYVCGYAGVSAYTLSYGKYLVQVRDHEVWVCLRSSIFTHTLTFLRARSIPWNDHQLLSNKTSTALQCRTFMGEEEFSLIIWFTANYGNAICFCGKSEQTALEVLMCLSGITTITMYLVQICWRCGCYCRHCRDHKTRYFASFSLFVATCSNCLFSGSSSLHGTFSSVFVFKSLLSFFFHFFSFLFFLRVLYYDFFSVGAVVVVAFRTCAISYSLAWNINIWIECSTASVLLESLWRKHQTHQHSAAAAVSQPNRTYHIFFLSVCHRSSVLKLKSWTCAIN